MATFSSAETALRRARKRFAHATRQLGEAQSESARKRHARRAHNAARLMQEASRAVASMWMLAPE